MISCLTFYVNNFLCSVAQVSYYVNKKFECFPLQFVVYIVTVLKFEAIFYWFVFQNPLFFSQEMEITNVFELDLEFSYIGYGKDSVRSDMAYPILYLVSFLDAADTKPIEQQFWKERLEQSVKHKYFATQI